MHTLSWPSPLGCWFDCCVSLRSSSAQSTCALLAEPLLLLLLDRVGVSASTS